MALTITHSKTNTVADWTQADLDAQILLGNFAPGTLLADIVLPSDWNDDHSLAGSIAWGEITGTLSSQSDLQTALDAKVTGNTAISGATNTKITYDAKGLVTAGAAATTADINDSSNRRYVTDAQLTVIGNTSGTNTGDQTNISGNAGTATALQTGRTISITGDLGYTSPSFDGSGNVTAAGTLATVNANVGSFGSATQAGTFTVNGKGLITAASNVTVTPAIGSVTGLGTGVATALAINTGSAGSVVLNGGALGTPSSGVATNLTGTAAGLTAGTVTTNANLTGDVTSVGNATTLATVNANVGSFTNANITVNAKGLITAASNGSAGGAVAFSGITSATNTTAAMVVGTGASLSVSGSGTIAATSVTGFSGTSSGTNTGDQTTITGNAGTATALQNARNIGGVSFDGTADIVPQTIQVIDAAADTTTFPMLAGSATGSLQPLTDPGLSYNASTNALTATTFIGALTGNASTATSAATLTTPRTIGGTSFNGSENIVPTTVNWVNDAADTTCFVAFGNASGTVAQQVKSNTGFTYNASTNAVAATTFTGAFVGNVTGNVTGSSGSTTGNAATVTTNANLTGDVTSVGNATSIAAGVIVNADVNNSAAIAVSKLAALTTSRAMVTDGSGFASAATTTATEIGYVNGVTSAIQTQLNTKAALTVLTPVAAAGATSYDFTVTGARVIYFSGSGLSTNGTSDVIIQLGDAGGIENTGYAGVFHRSAGTSVTNEAFSSGFIINGDAAGTDIVSGLVTLSLIDSTNNIWAADGGFSRTDAAVFGSLNGAKTLSQAITTVRITTAGGANTLDAGTINVSYF